MNRIQTGLYRAGLRVFEDLGFMLPTLELDREQAAATFHSAVSIDFNGPVRGRLLVVINGDILPALASNMLGEDNAPSALRQEDALKELVNVICGNLLPLIAGSAAVFDVGEPKAQPSENAPDPNLPIAARQAIGLERGRAELLLFLSECPPG